ncbi:hypothetical protein I302_101388 [Kwoniella bestiolae CBS 10118]|uniref:Uncharacterized protein n=1 Tax=Kwoniella bestiolae CBS 10118 TaxID=1296100 RepID=A0A1B9GC40_9TREE|nr:hypothetical protein I302_00071 [Kwoniella bestiolae CBS 10118]OCF28583.1 hypothetical protein I302_00071 [Kwoniella bestiolae CBS 10118]
MEDFVRSRLGADSSDAEIRTVISKPIWHLVPLPLRQINPSAYRSLSIRGQIPSLRSCCMSVISKNLHSYSIDQFQHIPKVFIQRIISRIRNDRLYEVDFENENKYGRGYQTRNPDEATIWALSALLDPESTGDFQLSLPQESVLQYLTPNNLSKYPLHPLVELPILYRTLNPNAGVSLLTTLTLDGMDGIVTDQNIQALKYCTSLTGLWMKACKVSDNGVRLLTSSLLLPGERGDKEGRGLWRLRSWSLGGCRGVSDRSMRSFGRYPGLVMLDVRDTSCTTSAIDIFNRTCQNIFAGYNPDFQPCTEGLLDLFSRSSTSSAIMDKLCLTLIKLFTNTSSNDDDKSHISLNIHPSHRPIEEKFLPQSSTNNNTPSYEEWKAKRQMAERTVYRGNGVGQIYGSSVSGVTDEVGDFRKRRKIAIEMEGKESEQDRYAEMSSVEKRNYTRQKNKEEKEWREAMYKWKTDDVPKSKPKIYKGRGKKGEAERSKSFVMGTQGEQILIDKLSRDDRSLMLVRMVNDDWERLSWTVNAGTAESNQKTKGGFDVAKTSLTQKIRATNLVEGLLGSTMSTFSSSQQSSSQSSQSNPFKQPSSQPTLSSSPIHSPQTPQRDRNPFKSQVVKSNSMGAKPLSSPSSSQYQSIRREAGSQSVSSSGSPFSFSQRPNSGSESDIRPFVSSRNILRPTGDERFGSASKDELSFSFASGTRKRTFDGSASSGIEAKRGGMKMFSIGSQRR